MSDLNFQLLQENIRSLIDKNGLTQQKLAEIAGMTQANVSKALNPNEKKQFTIDQLYRISQYFSVSLDTLTGNKAAERTATSPRAILAFLIEVLRLDKARVGTVIDSEEVFEVEYEGYQPSCRHETIDVEYPAIFFPSYAALPAKGCTELEYQEVFSEYTQVGNETQFREMNAIIDQLQPMIELYKKGDIPDEAFQMIVGGYLKKLRDK